MKIEKFTAGNTQHALRQVRDAHGAEAVILSNRRTEAGIEIIAAIEFDDDLYRSITTTPDTGAADFETDESLSSASQLVEAADISEIRTSLNELQSLFATHLLDRRANHVTTDPQAKHCFASAQLQNAGFGRQAAEYLKTAGQFCEDQRLSSEHLAAAMSPFALSEPLLRDNQRQVIAVVGQTGVGKTTTIAKLAVAAARRGTARIALVSADGHRIGAHQQLSRLAQILDIPILEAPDNAALQSTLEATQHYDHVLIDTAGRAPGDRALESQLVTLQSLEEHPSLLLTVAANVHPDAIRRAMSQYVPFAPVAVALTKLDESTNVAAALSPIIEHGLPLAYLSAGQRIPEDLHAAKDRLPWLSDQVFPTYAPRPPAARFSTQLGERHEDA